ncbi:MAG TPA: SHOCT domain-containing protein [Nocardioides sp.]|uniref:SHOCT domain-containing protein n=1 Tax=Nocardioides sp. TaxID=35761 RepID=UPI002CEF707F|nr:SHOCT domain-containing protein [Nocardioides sp.]HTW16785.1 SHOCT domain-containing protein [Nocardioides sp.]
MLLRPYFGPRLGRPGLIGPAGRTPVDRPPPPAVPAGGAVDPLIAALKELASLHRSGDLSDDEFSQAKARLLA